MGILNVATYVTVDGQYVNVLEMNQYQNKIRFLQLTGISGTLTSQQINLLRSDNTNYIIVDNELYNCNDLQDDNGYLVYTHTGADASNNVNIKTLSITLTNNNWSIQTTPVQPKIPVANTNEAVQFAEDERQKSKNLLDNSTLKTGAYLYVDGRYENLSEYITFEPISVIPNSTITVSCPNFVSKGSSGFVFFKDGVYVSGLDSNVLTATVPANANQVTYNFNMAELTLDKAQNAQIEYGSVATSYQPYNGAIVHEKEIEITTGDAILNTNFVTSGEVSWVKQGKLVVVSFSDIKFNGTVAHQNLYFSGLPKKAIKAQTFLLYENNASGGSSIRCMMQKDSTQIINWYQDITVDTNAQYYGQFTYTTDEN